MCLCAFILSCSFNSEVEYEIWNESGESLIIFVEGFENTSLEMDTSNIANGTRLMFFDHNVESSTATKYLDDLNEIGFQIFIATESGKLYKKDPMDISNWRKIYPERKSGIGRVQLTVEPQDFE